MKSIRNSSAQSTLSGFLLVIFLFFWVGLAGAWEIEREGFSDKSPAAGTPSNFNQGFVSGGNSRDFEPAPRRSPSQNLGWQTIVGETPQEVVKPPQIVPVKQKTIAPPPPPTPAKPKESDILKTIEELLTINLPAEMPPPLYINNLCKVQYAGAVSMAREGMRLLYGKMSEDEKRLFEARWEPLFLYPSAEIISYLNQLNPLLIQFISLRTTLNDSIENFNATQMTVIGATQIGDALSVVQAMENAALYTAVIKGLHNRIKLVGDKIIALGDPPNAFALMNRAKKKHEDACREFTRPVRLQVKPAHLQAVADKKYEFIITIPDFAKLKKPSLKWFFNDDLPAWDNPEQGKLVIKKTFRAKDPIQQTLTVQLQTYPGPKTLAVVKTAITMIKDPGCWVLVDYEVQKNQLTDEELNVVIIDQNIDPETGRAETSLRLPEIVAGQLDRCQYSHEWQVPPQRLFPGRQLSLPVMIARRHNFLGMEKVECPVVNVTRDVRNKWRRYKTLQDNSTCSEASTCISLETTHLTQKLFSRECSGGQPAVLPYKGRENRSSNICGVVPPYDYKWSPALRLGVVVTFKGVFCFYPNESSYINGLGIEGQVLYNYKWDPTGNQLKPLDCGSGTATATGQPPDYDPAAAIEAYAVQIEKIAFHQHNIKHFDRNIKALKERLEECDSQKKIRNNQLIRDLLYAEDARQREIDAITTIKTGKFVRTRTALDALNLKIMAEQSRVLIDKNREIVNKWHKIERIRERGQRLIDLAPVEEREELDNFLKRHYSLEDVANGNSNKLFKAFGAVANRVIGSSEVAAQAHLEDADFWDTRLEEAQNVKTFCDYYLMALSFAQPLPFPIASGPPPLITASGAIFMGYSGATGFWEGGMGEGIRRTLSAFHVITIITDAGLRGFQDGVINHLEDYARNPQKIRLAETQAGADGAAWSAGTAAAFAVAMRLGMGKLNAHRRKVQQLKIDKMRQAARLRHFNQRYAEADAKITVFRQRVERFSAAGKAGASRSEMLNLRAEMDGVYRDIKNDWFAKMRMKTMARNADFRSDGQAGFDHKVVHHYNAADRRHTGQLKKRLAERMREAGFNLTEKEFKLYSNSASKGGVGMDIDLGVKPPDYYKMKNGQYVLVDGKRVVNEEYKDWLRNLSRTVDGKTSRVSLVGVQAAGEKELAAAFKDVYRQKPGEAMVNFTTSFSPDAYQDVHWLKGPTSVAYETTPKWTQQAAEVTQFKVNSMARDHPSLGYYAAMQENSRGLVKDFDTKMKPLFFNSRNPKAVRHLTELRNTMKMFANNEIGPIEAERRLRMLTGNSEGVIEVARRFGFMLHGLRPPGSK